MEDKIVPGLLKGMGLKELFDLLIILFRELVAVVGEGIEHLLLEAVLEDHQSGKGGDFYLLDDVFREIGNETHIET